MIKSPTTGVRKKINIVGNDYLAYDYSFLQFFFLLLSAILKMARDGVTVNGFMRRTHSEKKLKNCFNIYA